MTKITFRNALSFGILSKLCLASYSMLIATVNFSSRFLSTFAVERQNSLRMSIDTFVPCVPCSRHRGFRGKVPFHCTSNFVCSVALILRTYIDLLDCSSLQINNFACLLFRSIPYYYLCCVHFSVR